MSNLINEKLLERAAEAIDYCINSPNHMDEQIERAIDSNDLELLLSLVNQVDGLRAQEHFRNYDIVGNSNVY